MWSGLFGSVFLQGARGVGERTTAPAIAPARSPPLEMNRLQLAAPEGVFEAIPELEFNQTANLAAERGRVWFRSWQGAVRVGDCQCRRIAFGQFLLVRPADPFLILSKCSL